MNDISIIDYSLLANEGSIYVIWDLGNSPQDDFQPSLQQLLDLLMDAEYIADYYFDDRCNKADIAVVIDGRRYRIELERFLADEINDAFCINVLHQYLKAHV